MYDKLHRARAHESRYGSRIPEENRPSFHLSPWIGWTNDPNGFSYYQGKYHLFYQSNPYDTVWNAMHWGHAVSRDLLHWEHLPCALAPDTDYDNHGCFSGSALELPDGRHLLLYTGVRRSTDPNIRNDQTQCIALGDGLNYEKYAGNPVLGKDALPGGLSIHDFRDPKIWQEQDGSYHCVVGARKPDAEGVILHYQSTDALHWRYEGVLLENDGRLGTMWECPDYFTLDGWSVLLVSPTEMKKQGDEYHDGHGTVCLTGHLDPETKMMRPLRDQPVDYGIDFYAPQTALTPDGRRVMIGWMQSWDACDQSRTGQGAWFGQMSLPRELRIRDGVLYQQPVRELLQYRSEPVVYRRQTVSGLLKLPGVFGRTVDLELSLYQAAGTAGFREFSVYFARNEAYHTRLRYDPETALLELDRQHSGGPETGLDQCRCRVSAEGGVLCLRIILDRFSVEVFVGDGRQVMTLSFMTDPSAQEIIFHADGNAEMDLNKYDLLSDPQSAPAGQSDRQPTC